MKRKLIAVLLAAIMLVTGFGTVLHADDAESGVQVLINNLAARTPEDRKSITNALIPLIITDTGLDALEYYIEDYDPTSDQMFDVVVRKLLNFTDKETVLSIFGYLRMIDEGIREDYFVGFQKRKECELSQGAQTAFEDFVKRQSRQYDGIEKIMTEDDISIGAIARLLEIPYKMNDSKPLLKNAPGGFAVCEVSDKLRSRIQFVIDSGAAGDIKTVDEALGMAISYINDEISPVSKTQLKTVLGEIGLYKFVPSDVAPGAGSGGAISGEKMPEIKDGKLAYSYIGSNVETGYDIVEIYRYKNGKKEIEGGLEVEEVVSIEVSSPDVMLYKIEDEGFEAIKYSVYKDGVLKCKVSDLGKYALRLMHPYFEDANGWGKSYIEALYNRGIISGKGEKTFAPDDNITREEFVKLIVETAAMPKVWTQEFSDVNADAWYAGYIGAASKNGVINGMGDGRFGVGENITRQDMSKILYELLIKEGFIKKSAAAKLDFADADMIAPYASESVSALSGLGIITGDDMRRFNPTDNATRQEASKLIYKLLEFYVK